MKRILYFQHVAEPGGSGLCLVNLLRRLDRSRFQPIVAMGQDGPLVERLQELSVDVVRVPRQFVFGYCSGVLHEIRDRGFYGSLWRFPVAAVQAFRAVRRLRPDLVHVNSLALVPLAVGAKLAGAKVIIHIREQSLPGRFGLRRAVVRFLVRHFTDEAVTICRANGESLGPGFEELTVVHNSSLFDGSGNRKLPEDRSALGLKPGQRMILYVGGGTPAKGPDLLLDAVQRVRSPLPFVVVVLGSRFKPRPRRGEHAYAEKLARLEAACGERVKVIGLVEDVAPFYAACDFLVFPSVVPHFANPVVEAASMAKPALMPYDPVGREMIVDGSTGLLFRPGDADDLAEKMARLLEQPDLCGKLGEQARQLAMSRYDPDEDARRLTLVYDRVLGLASADAGS